MQMCMSKKVEAHLMSWMIMSCGGLFLMFVRYDDGDGDGHQDIDDDSYRNELSHVISKKKIFRCVFLEVVF